MAKKKKKKVNAKSAAEAAAKGLEVQGRLINALNPIKSQARRSTRKKKHSYKEVKNYVKQKAALKKRFINPNGRSLSEVLGNESVWLNESNKREAQALYNKINIKNIGRITQQIEVLQNNSVNVRLDFDNTATNMRQWAVIKKYHDLVNEGIIKPKFTAIDDYHEIYGYMEKELTVDEMKEIIEEAEAQTERRRERLSQKTFDSPMVDFSEVIKLMEG